MSERSWLLPSVLLTVGLGATALLITPDYSGIMPALGLMPLWLFVSAALACLFGFFRMAAARVKSPIRHIIDGVRQDWRRLLLVAAGITLAGLNMIAFLWTKPLLNYFVPFWADPALAHIDRLLFLGHDPWRLLGWLNSTPMAIFYHRGWFAFMIITLLLVLFSPPSRQKSALMLTYFLLWTVVGPVIHILLPAAGPVFFQQLGYGTEFAGIGLPADVREMTDFLWAYYSEGRFGPGAGISAMPSLHIATTTWMVLAITIVARRWAWPMGLVGTLIFLLSISFGWHYAIDGIVGAAAAIGCYRLCERVYAGQAGSQPVDPAPTLEPETA
jgi:hypothetical protein